VSKVELHRGKPINDLAQAYGGSIADQLPPPTGPEQIGFVLVMFRPGDNGAVGWSSNCSDEGAVEVLRTFVALVDDARKGK
jgi:hypothetical protein